MNTISDNLLKLWEAKFKEEMEAEMEALEMMTDAEKIGYLAAKASFSQLQ